MEEGFFAKVNDSSSVEEVLASMNMQKEKKQKKLMFDIIAQVVVSDEEFKKLLRPISQSNGIYVKYGQHSVYGDNGIFQCISIENSKTSNRLIAYTAGRTFPLYVSYNAAY